MRRDIVLYGVTAPISALSFLQGQLGYMTDAGWQTHLVCPDDDGVRQMCRQEGTTFHALTLDRTPNPKNDIRALASLIRIVRDVQPTVVVAGTPKMSLLLLLVSWLLRIPRRIYLCHGLRFEGASGYKRKLLITLERILAGLATLVVPVSKSVFNGLVDQGVDPRRLRLLGLGSPNGVDVSAPYPTPAATKIAARTRFALTDATIILFVGRLTHDKGIESLVAAASALDTTQFALAGSAEPNDSYDEQTIQQLKSLPNVHILGHVDNVQDLYSMSHILLLPTRREGLPTVVLEAAAAGVPTVAYAVTGTTDAIRHQESGVLVKSGDVNALVKSLRSLIQDTTERERLGRGARAFVEANYRREQVWIDWLELLSEETSGV